MANKKNLTGNSGLSANLLPKFYQTPSNKKFLQATIDQLFQPGSVKKTSGFIGRQNAKAATRDDLYVAGADAVRTNYQLEPSLTIKDKFGNVTFYKDYIDYINQVDVFGGNVKNHSRLNAQEFYSWDPHIDWDKFVNFQNYYWMPFGPEIIAIAGQGLNITSTYTVDLKLEGNANAYVFTPNGLTVDPILKLYRGHTYTFDINSPSNPFSIKTERSIGSLNRYLVDGMDVAVEHGSITITIPDDAPNILFYQSETDINVGGVIEIYDVTEATFLDVESDILGKKNYVLPNGVALSNGMLVEFTGKVKPAMYETGSYYVEGVGTAIKLVAQSSLEVISAYTTSETVEFDNVPFDSVPFDGATGFAAEVDYITVNRASVDRNPWSRYNRWVHKDVISTSAEFNGIVPVLDQNARAVRPIIEFQANLKLFNFGSVAIDDVDLIDTYTTDVFSTIEGSMGYNIDGVDLVSGYKILVVADTDPLVRNKIYRVEKLTIQGNTQLHLVEHATPEMDQVTLVKRGVENQSHAYWYNGSTWIKAQTKSNTNQPPKFDVVDDNGYSYGDTSVYSGSTFTGTNLFSYKVGTTGVVDPKLGFIVSHKNVNNIGDLVFEFALATDTFQYKNEGSVTTHPINIGYLESQSYGGSTVYSNGWQTCTTDTVQAAVRIYNDDKVNNFDLDIFDDITDLSDLVVRVYVNGIRLDKAKWELTDTTVYKRVVLTTDIATTDILTIRAFAKQPINSNGYYEIPVNLQNNPLNDKLTEFTLGEVLDHVNSIVDNSLEFQGAFPGAGNLRDLGNITNRGTKFVQHSGPLSLGIYHITSQESNIIDAISRSEGDYNNFKRTFIAVAETLGVDADPEVMVELILQRINANKPKTSPYYFSDMVPYGAKVITNLTVDDYRIKTYPLSTVFTLDTLSNKAVGVYLNGVQLIHGTDYTFDNQGLVVIKAAIANGDTIATYEYDSTDGCFIPATPTKLGLWPKFEPKLYLDTSLVTPRWMIQGHDGSQVAAYGTYGLTGQADYRDGLVLELEKRIYNNIKVSYDPSVFDIADIIPGYNRSTDYSLEEFNQVLAPNFYKWTGMVGVDFAKPLSYDRGNSFTFNYSMNYSPDGKPVPAYWRGIYRWMIDTDRPHLCPWECLGITVKPEWWDSTYGPAPYTSDNLMLWTDLANGILREPNVPAVKLEKYVHPYLAQHIPVDDQGNLISPLYSGIVSGSVTQSTNNNFVFGDVSPVEAAWRRSSHYPFSILATAMLLTPAKTFGLALDRSRIVRNLAGQLVYSDTKTVVRPSDIVMPSIASSTTRVQTAGIINYVVDYIMNYIFSNNVVTYNNYKENLSLLTPQLAYRVGAFTNKDQFKLLLESKTPVSYGSVFVPAEDYTLFLNKTSAVKKLSYSGIVITKLSTGFEIKGYSRSAPYFKYYNYVRSGSTINVGGISASYTQWTQGSRYNVGSIVKYGSDYYSVKTAHIATQFDTATYAHLPALPIVGGATIQLRTSWDKANEVVAPYGITFATIQEVADFIAGYAEWLKDQGFVFDQFSTATGAVTNWATSVKEFLFWTTQNWSSGEDKWSEWESGQPLLYSTIVRYNGDYFSAAYNIPASANEIFDEEHFDKLDGLSNVGSSVISLSPAASAIVFNTTLTVVDDVSNPFNPYEIFKVDGTPIDIGSLNSFREGNTVTYSTSNGDGIYCAAFYLVQNEHVVTLNNNTIFNDTIYAPASGYRQERLKISGYVTSDWYGGLDIPGFVYDQAAIKAWQPWQDYTAGDVVLHQGFYYSANAFVTGSAAFDATLWRRSTDKPTAQVIPNWTNLASQFNNFYSLEADSFNADHQSVAQHLIGYQKRQYLENIIQDDVSEFKFFQGMIREKGTQNVLNKLFDPLTASGEESLTFYEEWAIRVGQYGATNTFENIEFILDEGQFKNNPQGVILSNNKLNNVSSFIINQAANDVYIKPVGYTGAPFTENTDFNAFLRTPGYINPNDVYVNIPQLSDVLTQNIAEYTDGTLVWCTFANPPRYWDVFRFSNQDTIQVTGVTYDGDNLVIIADADLPFTADDYIGITGVDVIAGFYKPDSVDGNIAVIPAPSITGFPSEFTQQAEVVISMFISQRVDNIDSLDNVGMVNAGEIIWADSDNNGKWAVWEYNPVYTKTQLHSVNDLPANVYGNVLAINNLGNLSAINTASDEVVTREKAGVSVPWALRQTLPVPFVAHKVIGNDVNIGMKGVSSIAFSNDGTWLAVGRKLVGHASVITSASTLKVVDVNGTNSAYTEQGVVSIYKKDVNNVYTLDLTIASPAPATGEHFGASVAFTDDKLFIGAPGTMKVYEYQYAAGTPVTVSYNPVGSVGATIVVSSTNNILPGMEVVGTGFTDGQYVLSVDSVAKTVTLSGSPSSTPSNTVSFITVQWEYKTAITTAISGFGNALTINKDLSKLLVKTGAVIRLYDVDTLLLIQAFTGVDAAVSAAGDYIAVSSGSNVAMYSFNGTAYTIYQAALVKHNLQLSGNFGTRVEFMNGSETLVVYNTDGSTSNVLVYDVYNTLWVYSETIATAINATADHGFVVADNQVLFIDNDVSSLYFCKKLANNKSWNVKHNQDPIPDAYKIKQVFLYNKAQGELIKYIDVIDPVQGKIAGIADAEIKMKSFYDPASYSIGTDAVTVNADSFWSVDQVGSLWWDLRQAKFISGYFGDVAYRTNIWNTLAAGASIDIYEWVESSMLPASWDSLADTPEGTAIGISGTSLYGNAVYSVRQKYDNISKSFKNKYYFWVKNKSVVPNVPGRRLSALGVSQLISNPRGQGLPYMSITGLDTFNLVNVKQYLKDSDVVLSVEYWVTDSIDKNVHSQWKLISNDTIVDIPAHIEEKWFDSLCGGDASGRSVPDLKAPIKLRYGIENRPRQSMFVNRVEALKELVESVNRTLIQTQITQNYDISGLDVYDPVPSIAAGLYDVAVDTDAELRLINTGSFTPASLLPVVAPNGSITGIEIVSAGRGYIAAPMITIVGDGVNAKLRATINTRGQITGSTVINGGEGYAQATTTCTVRPLSVLVKMDSGSDNNWSIYGYDTVSAAWARTLTQSYDVRKYWQYTDWFATGYNQFSAPDFAVSTFSELNSISPAIGEMVKVITANSGGWLLLEKYADSTSVDWTQTYTVVGIQNGTIQLSSLLYNFSNTPVGYDAGTYDGGVYDLVAAYELRAILTVLKNNVFIGTLKQAYLDLFLASIRYAHSEQVYLDWAFKTSFIRATHAVGALAQPVTYPIENLSNFEDYISEVKPYRTHIREYISNYTGVDQGQVSVTDFDLQPVYHDGSIHAIESYVTTIDGVPQVAVADPEIQSYPWKYWLENVGFTITDVIIIDGGSGYVSQPTVTIDGGGGSGATAKAYVANGKVNRLLLITPGSKYISAPSIGFDGGLAEGGTAARAVAIIGDSVVRSNLIKMKFDRVTQTYFVTDLSETETFPGEQSRVQYPLQWAPDVTIGSTTVTIDGVPILRDAYRVSIVKSTTAGYTRFSGSITFDNVPAVGKSIVVTYLKDVSLLNAADRIQYFYNPGINQIGKELSQLMTGIDYGGVQVTGLGFELSGGWDKRPYTAEAWDVYDREYNDYITTVGANTHSFTLPYTPVQDTELNVYYIAKYSTSYLSDGSTLDYLYDKTVGSVTVSTNRTTNTSGSTTTYTSPINELSATIVVADAASVSSGMGIIGAGFNNTHRVLVVDGNTVTLNKPPVSQPNGTLHFINNVSGNDVLYVDSTAGVAVGDIIKVSMGSVFKYNQTVVTQVINGTSVKMNQLINTPIYDGLEVLFTRTLVDTVDYSILANTGIVKLENAISSGNSVVISGSRDPIRLDDSNYDTVNQTNADAIMLPLIADGTTATFTIPNTFAVAEGDTFIIRQSTSDGSIAPQELDYDTTLIGGDLAYSSATGINPEDMIVDGDGFVTPTSSPAPDEVVPGQVVDTVAIKVFDRPNVGSANIKIDTYRADGINAIFEITNTPSSPGAVIVKLEGSILTVGDDYTVDYGASTIELLQVPTEGATVSIFSVGFSGLNILDVDYFVADGIASEFITHAPWNNGDVTSLVYVNGDAVSPTLFKTNSTYDLANVVGLRFDTPPTAGSLINFIIVVGSTQTFSVTKTERVIADGSLTYPLAYPVGNSLLNETNMIVRVDQQILFGPNTAYFTVGGNRLNYTADPTRIVPNSMAVSDVKVVADGTLLKLGVDYTVDLNGFTVKINRAVYKMYVGKELAINVLSNAGYSYNSATNEITFRQAYDSSNVIQVITSFVHDTLDINRNTVNVSSTLDITPDTAEYFRYKAISSGRITLDRSVLDGNYVWVTKNNTLLTPSVDYKLKEDRQSIVMKDDLLETDLVEIITFGRNVLPVGVAYMQFKDMLNRVQYKRLNANKQTRLLRDLRFNDTTIEVEDASKFDSPNITKGRPGVIEIRGERIEYFEIDGNILRKLRRATLGTGAPLRHRAGSFVTEIGSTETIPYTDETIVTQRVSDGTNIVPLDFIPAITANLRGKRYNTQHDHDSIEVFVGGYDASINWAPGIDYTVGTIVTIGTYTYKVTAYHQSGATFKSPVTTLTTVDGVRTVVATNVDYTSAYEFFIGNIRLKKSEYTMFNTNIAPYSPEGDLTMPADFEVDGTTPVISLTSALPVGTHITVIRRICSEAWDAIINIQEDTNRVANFLKAQPGTWYTDAQQISTGTESVTLDSTIITFDADNLTFDNDSGTYN